jgi:hypothetical protein
MIQLPVPLNVTDDGHTHIYSLALIYTISRNIIKATTCHIPDISNFKLCPQPSGVFD